MPFYECKTHANKIEKNALTQFSSGRGVGCKASLTLKNDCGMIVVSFTQKDSGNFSIGVSDDAGILTMLKDNIYNNDPRGGMQIYEFQNGKGKTVTFHISYPNSDWAYGCVCACEISSGNI